MLDDIAQTAPAMAPVSDDKYKVGDYVVYPRLGLSLVSARKEMEISGMTLYALEVRPLNDLKTSVSIPEMKVPTSSLRRPAPAARFKEVLELVAGKAKGEGQRWHTRAQKYEERLKSSDLFETASIVRDIMSKHRHKKFTNLKEDDVPADVVISYSERMLVREALGLLSREMTFVTGISMIEANRLFLAAALDPSVKISELSFVDKGEVSMPAKKFEEIFGRGVRAASKANDNQIRIAIPAVSTLPGRRTGPTIDMAIADRPLQSRVQVGARGRPVSSGSNFDTVRPELRALYAKYQPQCALSGYKGAAFKLAAQHCFPPDFDLLCQLVFLKNELKPSPETIAQKMNISVDDVWKRGEEAFDRLKKHGDASRSKTFLHVKFPSRVSAASIPTEPVFTLREELKDIFDSESQYFPKKGLSRAFVMKAANILDAQEFEVLSKMAMRTKENIVTPDDVAQEKNVSREEILVIRNAASAKLRKAYAGATPYILQHKPLNDYVEPDVKPARVERPPVDMKMVGEIIDGKFRLVLEMPLSDLNGADTFRVEGRIFKQGETPVSVQGAGKIGKGRGGYFNASGAVNTLPKLEQ